MDIHIRSEGCNDPGKAPNTCGIAYIKVNGHDHSLHGRGHNVVVVDATTGNVTTKCAVFLYFFILIIFIFYDIEKYYRGSEKIILNKIQNKIQKKHAR